MRRPWRCLVMAAAAAIFWWPAQASAEQMRCSHPFAPSHHITATIEHWAAEVERLSGGRLQVELVGDSALFKPDDTITAVAKGHIECGFSVDFRWSRKLPLLTLGLAPFLTASPTIASRWAGSDAARFLESRMLEHGVQPVVWLLKSDRTAITSRGRFLALPGDFKDVTIRGLVPAIDRSLMEIGARPRRFADSKLYEALRVGLIDAAMADVAAVAARQLYEQQDHALIAPMASVYAIGYLSPAWFEGLNPDLQDVLHEAGRLSSAWSVANSRTAMTVAADVLASKGMQVRLATPEEIMSLREALLPAFLGIFLAETGEDGRILLDLMADIGGLPPDLSPLLGRAATSEVSLPAEGTIN